MILGDRVCRLNGYILLSLTDFTISSLKAIAIRQSCKLSHVYRQPAQKNYLFLDSWEKTPRNCVDYARIVKGSLQNLLIINNSVNATQHLKLNLKTPS